MAVLGTYLYITPPSPHSPLLSKPTHHIQKPTGKRSQNPKPAQNATNPNFPRGKGIYGEKGEKLGDEHY